MISSSQEILPEAVACHYDELDAFYREIWGEDVHHGLWITGGESREKAIAQLTVRVAKEARAGQGSRVCDIGCGYGATARVLARDFGSEVTALTVSPAQNAFAQSKSGGASNPRYLLGDWMQTDLADASFDAAIAIESSEHMPDKARFFQNAHRVLKPGGRLVVCAWLAREKPTPKQERWLLEPICREGRMPHMGTVSDYRRLAEAAGFSLEAWEDVSTQVERTWPVIAWRFFLKLLSRPAYARFLFNRHAHNRVFALTIFRLWLAYRTGAMRYVIFTWVKEA